MQLTSLSFFSLFIEAPFQPQLVCEKKQKVNKRRVIELSDYFNGTDSGAFSDLTPPQKKHKGCHPLLNQQLDKGQSILHAELVKGLDATSNEIHETSARISFLAGSQQMVVIPTSFPLLDDTERPNISNGRGKTFQLCDICDYCCVSSSTLSYHMINYLTDENPFQCKECSKTFKSRNNFNAHRRRHLPPQLQCYFCPKMFIFKKERDEHTNKHTGAKPYECRLCHASFTTTSGLSGHRKTHSVPKYECPFCQKKFIGYHKRIYCISHWEDSKHKALSCPVRVNNTPTINPIFST
jgi:hypothetical protein